MLKHQNVAPADRGLSIRSRRDPTRCSPTLTVKTMDFENEAEVTRFIPDIKAARQPDSERYHDVSVRRSHTELKGVLTN